MKCLWCGQDHDGRVTDDFCGNCWANIQIIKQAPRDVSATIREYRDKHRDPNERTDIISKCKIIIGEPENMREEEIYYAYNLGDWWVTTLYIVPDNGDGTLSNDDEDSIVGDNIFATACGRTKEISIERAKLLLSCLASINFKGVIRYADEIPDN